MHGSHIHCESALGEFWTLKTELLKNNLVEGFYDAKDMRFEDLKLQQQCGNAFLILTKKTSKFKSLFAFLKFSIFLSKKLPGETKQVSRNALSSLKIIRFSQDKIVSLLHWRVYKQLRGRFFWVHKILQRRERLLLKSEKN